MKKLLLSLLIGGIGTAIAVTPVSAVYVNVNTGIASLSSLPTGSWVGALNAGYNFNHALAVEVGYNLMPSSQFGTSVTSNAFDVAVKGTLPLSEMFSLYGRLGVGIGMNNWSGTAPAGNCILCQSGQSSTYALALAGIGASFKLSEHFDLRIEDYALIPTQNTYSGTANAVTGGVQYNF
jgi:hypothetical protein